MIGSDRCCCCWAHHWLLMPLLLLLQLLPVLHLHLRVLNLRQLRLLRSLLTLRRLHLPLRRQRLLCSLLHLHGLRLHLLQLQRSQPALPFPCFGLQIPPLLLNLLQAILTVPWQSHRPVLPLLLFCHLSIEDRQRGRQSSCIGLHDGRGGGHAWDARRRRLLGAASRTGVAEPLDIGAPQPAAQASVR